MKSLLPAERWHVAAGLVGLVLLAAIGHILLLQPAQGPWVFYDELGYQKLAQSLGENGRLALFNKQGLSYSPLYPLLLAPLYALHLSGPDAFYWTRIVNCVLMALAVVPIYKIARFVLPPGRSLVAAALSSLAPLMFFSTLEMSESLAYPLCLGAIWATLVAVSSPSFRRDLVVLALCLLATLARLQFAVLFPAVLGAIVLGAIAESRGAGWWRRVSHALRVHWLVTGANAALVIVGVAAISGTGVVSIAGRYANQSTLPAPSPWRIVKLVVEHVAGLEFAVGVIPFVGTLIASYLWLRHGARREIGVFAAVAVSVTSFLILMTAFASYGQSYVPGATSVDMPRIHERYLFYVVPLFVIPLIAVGRIPRTGRMVRIGLAAAAIAGLLPALIPYRTVINPTVAIDSFSLVMFATDVRRVGVTAVDHAALAGVAFASCIGIVYALARPRSLLVFFLLAAIFIWMSAQERRSLDVAGAHAIRVSFDGPRNWVDVAAKEHDTVLLGNPRLKHDVRSLPVVETVFFNMSVRQLYFRCRALLPAEFGEHQVQLDSRGRFRDGAALVRARYAVVPASFGVEGTVVARDVRSRLVLIKPPGGILRVAAGSRSEWTCATAPGG
jgi:hypothetical protein